MYRMLIVDDEKAIRETIELWFLAKGFAVDSACDGLDALDKVKAEKMGYDVIIMDLEMPKMKGLEAINHINVFDKNIPVIAMTGFSESTHKVISAGASLILSKPLKLKDLEDEVNHLLNNIE